MRSYQIWRDGVAVGTSPTTTWTDEEIPANGLYRYHVVAIDPAGNASTPSTAANLDISSILSGTVSQSATYDGNVASRAVDGNLEGRISQGSTAVAVRGSSSTPHWDMDLGQVTDITSVRLWAAYDFSYRTRNVYVFVSEEPFSSTNPSNTANDPDIWNTFFGGTLWRGYQADIPAGVQGRYIRVQLASSGGRQQLSEVQIEGVPVGGAAPAPADVTAPTTPSNLSVDTSTPNVALAWGKSIDDRGVASYEVARDGVVVANTTLTHINDLVEVGTYTWTVTAIDGSGNRSGVATVTAEVRADAEELIPFGAQWRYLDTGATPPANWVEPGFDDTGWAQGNAQLGFGDGDETTVTDAGHVVTWFRTTFDVANPAVAGGVIVDLVSR